MLEKHILRNNPQDQSGSTGPLRHGQQPTPETRFPTLLKILMLVFFVCVLLFVTSIAVLRMPNIQIKQISVTGTTLLDPMVLSDASMRFLSQKTLFAIPRGNSLLFNKHSLDRYIKNTYPVIAHIESSFIEPYHLQLTVQEYSQKYLWCTDTTMTDCYRVDNTGMIYDRSPDYTRGVYPVFITRLTTEKPIINNVIFTTIYEQELIEKMMDELSKSGFTVTMIDTSSVYDYQFFVSTLQNKILTNTTFIKVSKKPQTMSLHETLNLLLRDKIFQKDVSEKTLEYIDLRFPEKIFYKFSNTNHVPEPLDTITTTN